MEGRKLVGIFGSSRAENDQLNQIADELGTGIKTAAGWMLDGACTGLPYVVASSAYSPFGEEKSFVVGISPFSRDEHLRKPGMVSDFHNLIIYTGLGDNLEGKQAYSIRNLVSVNTIDAAIVLPGSEGTLLELELSLARGKEIVVVSGIVPEFDEMARELESRSKVSGTGIFYCNNPSDILKSLGIGN